MRKDATQDRPPILQIRAVASLLAEASQVPSGATANACTVLVWPVRVWRVCLVCGFQIRTVSASLAEASQDPSGATANAATPRRLFEACSVCGTAVEV